PTTAGVAEIAEAMTMAGLEVEHVEDPGAKFAAFSVARVKEAVQHPNADRLRVCQVETKDGVKEIVCGAPNARAGLVTIYAPIGTYIPGSGVTLEPRAVRGVVSNGMLCSAAELQIAEESDGILELDAGLAVGAGAAEALGLEAVIDFEVTPNRPDWLGVAGIARDLAATGIGKLKDLSVAPVPGRFANPIEIRVDGSDACPAFAGRVIRGLKNGPSPAWMQDRLRAIGLRPINALVDVTNFLAYDRARPLHVYDAAKLTGGFIEARLGREGEKVEALDGRTYDATPEMCVIADGAGPVGLGGVMGGEATGSTLETTEVFIESAWFDPIRTAQTGRDLSLISDAQYRFARGVDPGFVVAGLELATQLILEFCGGEASELSIAGHIPAPPPPIDFDPAYVHKLAGLDLPSDRIRTILEALGFTCEGGRVQPPSWRRDVEGKADLVEEVARIAGYGALPAKPLPSATRPTSGVLTLRQSRIRAARRALAAAGYAEAVTWSFTSRAAAEAFGGGAETLLLENPISAELDCMRPSILPGLIDAAGRNARRGFADVALFEIGPVFAGVEPADQRTAVAAILAPHGPRRWDHAPADDVFALKADLVALLDELGAPTANLQTAQEGPRPWWGPRREPAARAQVGAGRVRRDPPEDPASVGRRGPDLRVRGLAGDDPRAEEEGGEDAASPGAVAADAADPRLRVRRRPRDGGRRPGARRAVRRAPADRQRQRVRRLRGPRRAGRQEIGRRRGDAAAAREDALRRRDRGDLRQDRRRSRQGRRRRAARLARAEIGRDRLHPNPVLAGRQSRPSMNTH